MSSGCCRHTLGSKKQDLPLTLRIFFNIVGFEPPKFKFAQARGRTGGSGGGAAGALQPLRQLRQGPQGRKVALQLGRCDWGQGMQPAGGLKAQQEMVRVLAPVPRLKTVGSWVKATNLGERLTVEVASRGHTLSSCAVSLLEIAASSPPPLSCWVLPLHSPVLS